MRRSAFHFYTVIAMAALFVTTHTASAWEPKSPRDCRLAFLLGMKAFGYVNALASQPSKQDPQAPLFETIARIYAEELGATEEQLSSDAWRALVEGSVRTCQARATPEGQITVGSVFGEIARYDIDLYAAYLAGAYARDGTPTGFRLVDQSKGLYIAELLRRVFPHFVIEIKVQPGIPGNITLTLTGKPEDLADFSGELELIRKTLERKK